ncbi:MAG: carboxypeptidase-like regulatory domain-containing protein [Planctomycetota bacterium]|jgi:protocatechuate 3,4-dioxygenase beta subunit
MKTRKLFLWAGLLLVAGCDGGIQIRGVVCELRNPETRKGSLIFVNETSSIGGESTPVENAVVTLFHGGDYRHEELDETTIWKKTTRTDKEGRFRIESVTAPGSFHAIIRVDKEGYVRAEKVFHHDCRETHESVVILHRQGR